MSLVGAAELIGKAVVLTRGGHVWLDELHKLRISVMEDGLSHPSRFWRARSSFDPVLTGRLQFSRRHPPVHPRHRFDLAQSPLDQFALFLLARIFQLHFEASFFSGQEFANVCGIERLQCIALSCVTLGGRTNVDLSATGGQGSLPVMTVNEQAAGGVRAVTAITNRTHFGGCDPREFSHSNMWDPVSAWRALRTRRSRSMPGGVP